MSDHPALDHGLNGALGFEFTEITSDQIVAQVEVATIHQQPYGLVHGGVHCALIEAVASVGAAFWAVSQGMTGAVGVSNTTDFMRPVRQGRLIALGTPVHRGRTQQLWQVVVTSDDKLVARGQVRLHNLTDPGTIGGLIPEPV